MNSRRQAFWLKQILQHIESNAPSTTLRFELALIDPAVQTKILTHLSARRSPYRCSIRCPPLSSPPNLEFLPSLASLFAPPLSSPLTSLTLTSVPLSPAAFTALTLSLRAHTLLESLSLHHSPLSLEHVRALASLLHPSSLPPNLRALSLWDARLSPAAALVLAETFGLYCTPSLASASPHASFFHPPPLIALEVISLARNNIDDASAAALADALSKLPSLRRLILLSNRITDEGAEKIFHALTHSADCRLVELQLASNPITSRTILFASDLLEQHLPYLTFLDLSIADDDGFHSAAAALRISRYTSRNRQNAPLRDISLAEVCWFDLIAQGLNLRQIVPQYLMEIYATRWPPPEVARTDTVRSCSICRSTQHDKRTCPLHKRMQPPNASNDLQHQSNSKRRKITITPMKL